MRNQTTAILVDLETGKTLESYRKDQKMPVASVAKAVTAVYGIEALGPDYTFETKLFVDGKVKAGTLEGDLYLLGGGDPSLQTDDLVKFVDAVKKRGIKEISGNLFYDCGAVPEFLTIDPSQLPQESYNPGFSGLNLNNNKVLFSWEKKAGDHELKIRLNSSNTTADQKTISIVGKNQMSEAFMYSLDSDGRAEKWVVSKKILGKKGMRWLPVRFTSTFTTNALWDLFRRNEIIIREPRQSKQTNLRLELVFNHKSEKLPLIVKDMLFRSTNVTAEIIGVAAANFWGIKTPKLLVSGNIMTKWFNFVSKTEGSLFLNHSGLSSESRVSSFDFSRFLNRKETKRILAPLLKEHKIYGPDNKKLRDSEISVVAKTGTMHFNRGLAGYIKKNGTPRAAFAIFSADIDGKRAVKAHQSYNPPGSKTWLRQARHIENIILASWAKHYI